MKAHASGYRQEKNIGGLLPDHVRPLSGQQNSGEKRAVVDLSASGRSRKARKNFTGRFR